MNKEEYKKTDLGYLPLDWNTKRIEDICEILDSKRIPLNKEQRDNMKGDIPYYGANGVVDYINDYLFDEDLILMAEDGGYFDEYRTRHIAYKVKGKSWVNNHAHVLKVLDSQTYEFIYYTLVHKNILPFINGGTRAKLNQADLKKILIQYPPLKEQQKIASILSSVDAAIEKTEQVIAKTEEVKKGLMQQLLTKGIGHTEFKQTEIGEIPVKWDVVNLDDVFERVTRKNDGNPENPVMTISAKGGLQLQGERFNKVIAGNSLEKYLLIEKGEFAYNRGNSKTYPVGVIYKLDSFEKAVVPFVYYCFKNKINVDKDFYQQYFAAHMLDRQLKRIISSSARQDGLLNINASDFFRLKIAYPPLATERDCNNSFKYL